MAIQRSAAMRKLTGSIGGITYRVVAGRQILSEKSSGSSLEPTELQVEQRTHASFSFKFANTIAPVLKLGFKSRKAGRTPCNEFLAQNKAVFAEYQEQNQQTAFLMSLQMSKKTDDLLVFLRDITITDFNMNVGNLNMDFKNIIDVPDFENKRICGCVFNTVRKDIGAWFDKPLQAPEAGGSSFAKVRMANIYDSLEVVVYYFIYDVTTQHSTETASVSMPIAI